MSEKKSIMVSFTASAEICKYLADKKAEGYNLSAFLRKIIEEFMENEVSKSEEK